MTRRKFIRKLISMVSSVFVGLVWVAKKALPTKFVRAVRLKKYPGHLKHLPDIIKQSKWSG